jgi:hypothetical protein
MAGLPIPLPFCWAPSQFALPASRPYITAHMKVFLDVITPFVG